MQKTSKTTKHRATPYQTARLQHGREAAEDYTELIADLIESNGEARTCEIAKHLGVSHVTALRTIRRLQTEGFVETSHHRPVDLTAKGRETAEYCKERHNLLLEFFKLLGVPDAIAETDVEGLEHHVSETTLNCIRTFLEASR